MKKLSNLKIVQSLLTAFLFLFITAYSISSNAQSSCGCDYTIPASTDGGIYFKNGDGGLNILPGKKACITAGVYPYISITGVVGTATQPITIANCGGQVIVKNATNYGLRLTKSRFIRFTGSGTSGVQYGFKSDGVSVYTSSGVALSDSVSNFELDHIEVNKAEAGFLVKINPYDCDPGTWDQGWTIKDISIHDNYVHNTTGEGYYLGHTSATVDIKDCSGNTKTVEPIKISGIKVYNNISDSTGWDGIQLSGASAIDVHNNIIKNFGRQNMGSQQAGLIFGGKCSGNIYNNTIINGTGNGMQVFGVGIVKIYNNTIVNTGDDGTSVRQDAIIIDDRPSPGQYTGLQFYIINNTIINPGRDCMQLLNSYGTMGTDNRIYNNLLVQPNGTSIYDDHYIHLNPNLNVDVANNKDVATIAQAGFVGAAANNYHLLSNSSSIDIGKNVSAYGVTTDLEGLTRPRGAGYDAGAYEYNTGAPPPNQLPTANAGNDIIITLPTNSTTLTGSGTDVDGTIGSYLWTKVSGPASFTIGNSSSASTAISNLVQGVYKFELKVTDNSGAIGKDTMQVTVNSATNKAPFANAGNDVAITLPTNSTTLTGSGTDTDGTISSYLWTKISGPSGGTVYTPNNFSTTINSLVQGVYKFTFTVTDNKGATGKDTVQVTVNPEVINGPVASAGNDVSITKPVSSATLNGSATDKTSTIASYRWKKISGPSCTIANKNAAQTTVASLKVGTYKFEITVTDNNGAIDRDTMQLIENAAVHKFGEFSTIAELISTDSLLQLIGDIYTRDVTTKESSSLLNRPSFAIDAPFSQKNNIATAYPNPVRDILTLNIKTEKLSEKLLLTITGVNGNVVYKQIVTGSQSRQIVRKINLSAIQQGTYIVNVKFINGEQLNTKFIKVN